MDPLLVKEMLAGVCAYLCVAVGAGLAATVLYFVWQRGKPWLPLPRLRWGRWTGGDIFLTIFSMFLSQALVSTILQKANFFEWLYEKEPSSTVMSLWVTPLSLPFFLLFTFIGLYYLSGTYPVDLGISRSRWPANLLVGCVGFVLATPLVLGLNTLLTLFSHVKKHPYQDLEMTGLPFEWCLVFLGATVAAPLTEELLFRGLILGWLRRASLWGHGVLIAMVLFVSLGNSFDFNNSVKDLKDDDGNPRPATWDELVSGIDEVNGSRITVTLGLGMLYVAWLWRLQKENLFLNESDFQPAETLPADATDDEVEDQLMAPVGSAESVNTKAPDIAAGKPQSSPELRDIRVAPAETTWPAQDLKQQRRKSGLAIFGSAMLFAMIHGTWPGPIALLLLGLVLGWVTQRTQNLLPAIVLHSLFNAVAAFTLLFSAL